MRAHQGFNGKGVVAVLAFLMKEIRHSSPDLGWDGQYTRLDGNYSGFRPPVSGSLADYCPAIYCPGWEPVSRPVANPRFLRHAYQG